MLPLWGDGHGPLIRLRLSNGALRRRCVPCGSPSDRIGDPPPRTNTRRRFRPTGVSASWDRRNAAWSTARWLLDSQGMRFVVVTKWFTGLGFALRLQDEGHDVELAVVGIEDQRQQSRYALVGEGLAPKRALADVMGTRDRLRDAYFIWDENHSVAENECLRA